MTWTYKHYLVVVALAAVAFVGSGGGGSLAETIGRLVGAGVVGVALVWIATTLYQERGERRDQAGREGPTGAWGWDGGLSGRRIVVTVALAVGLSAAVVLVVVYGFGQHATPAILVAAVGSAVAILLSTAGLAFAFPE